MLHNLWQGVTRDVLNTVGSWGPEAIQDDGGVLALRCYHKEMLIMSLARNPKNFLNWLLALWIRTCGEMFQWLLKAEFELNYATVKYKQLIQIQGI